MCVYVHMYVLLRVCVYIYIYVCVYKWIYVHDCAHSLRLCTYMRIYVALFICINSARNVLLIIIIITLNPVIIVILVVYKVYIFMTTAHMLLPRYAGPTPSCPGKATFCVASMRTHTGQCMYISRT